MRSKVLLGAVVALSLAAPAMAQTAVESQAPSIQAPVAATALAVGSGFSDGYAEIDGVRLHYVIGGEGPPLLLIPGWPETWWSWRGVMPSLAETHTVIAVDTRGMGDSSRPASGYDMTTVATDMFTLMNQLGHQRFSVVGHDIGVWIGYAMAADRPQAIERIAFLDSNLPGVTPSPPIFRGKAETETSWHFMFNQLDDLPEALVTGREREFLSWLYSKYAYRLGSVATEEYIRAYSAPGAMRAGFAYYRALPQTIDQNEARAKVRLTMPILTLGGEHGVGDIAETTLKPQADKLEGQVLAGCGHYLAEECPKAVLEKLEPFLAGR